MPAGLGFDARHHLVAVLAAYAEPPRRDGLQIRIAEPPAPAPLIATVTCRSADCQDRAIQRWFLPETAYTKVLRPVAGADGALALVVLRSVMGPGSGYLIRCETHCG